MPVSSSENNAELGLNFELNKAVKECFAKIVGGIDGDVNYIFTKYIIVLHIYC